MAWCRNNRVTLVVNDERKSTRGNGWFYVFHNIEFEEWDAYKVMAIISRGELKRTKQREKALMIAHNGPFVEYGVQEMILYPKRKDGPSKKDKDELSDNRHEKTANEDESLFQNVRKRGADGDEDDHLSENEASSDGE